MGRISAVKLELRHRSWAEEIEKCQSSGKNIKQWCKEKNINPNTFYIRLKVIREKALDQCSEIQSIVPLSISEEFTDEHSVDLSLLVSNEPISLINTPEKIVIRRKDVVIELPYNTSEVTIVALIDKALSLEKNARENNYTDN